MLDLLVDFAYRGELEPIQLGMPPDEVRSSLGEPWHEGQGRAGYVIWSYGALELYFNKGARFDLEIELFRIRFDSHHPRMPSLYPRPEQVSLFDFCAAASARGIAIQTESPVDPREVRIRVPETGFSAIFRRRGAVWVGVGRV